MANAHLDTLPAWAKELSEKYYSRTITMFILHGNVRDLVPFRREDAALEFCSVHRRLRIADGRKIALILDFAETIVPAGDVSSLASEDRNALVTLKRWAQHPAFLSADLPIL